MEEMDWGTVPAWASAVLTSGTLALGFYILLRDRKKEEREEANRVIFWLEYPPKGHMTATVLNTAERPISNVEVLLGLAGRRPRRVSIQRVVRPEEEVSVSLGPDVPLHGEPWYFRFTDSDGRRWIRDVKSNVLAPQGVSRGTRRRLWLTRRFLALRVRRSEEMEEW
ncbi:hypothetical protein ACH5A3_44730 [Streptomyces echinatus]|uniref:hypothetical protein n=1 Tax=Streptomyces echinatus TaxID=67293 RepID=UPI0037BA452A